MSRFLRLLTLFLVYLTAQPLLAADTVRVRMQTNAGDIVLELDRDNAPITVKNFLGYVESGFYDGTVFHRVIDDFMIQGGGYDEQLNKKETGPAIRNEATNGLKNVRGSIAMARTGVIHSATAQFFINVKDNPALNYQNPSPRGFGYAVFGKVVDGMQTVDRIRKSRTGPSGRFRSDVPRPAIIINKVSVE